LGFRDENQRKQISWACQGWDMADMPMYGTTHHHLGFISSGKYYETKGNEKALRRSMLHAALNPKLNLNNQYLSKYLTPHACTSVP
jgi:hypothetical protein